MIRAGISGRQLFRGRDSETEIQRQGIRMEKRELFQIGEVARMFHLSVGSLRHYEKSAFWSRNMLTRRQVTGIMVSVSLSA